MRSEGERRGLSRIYRKAIAEHTDMTLYHCSRKYSIAAGVPEKGMKRVRGGEPRSRGSGVVRDDRAVDKNALRGEKKR